MWKGSVLLGEVRNIQSLTITPLSSKLQITQSIVGRCSKSVALPQKVGGKNYSPAPCHYPFVRTHISGVYFWRDSFLSIQTELIVACYQGRSMDRRQETTELRMYNICPQRRGLLLPSLTSFCINVVCIPSRLLCTVYQHAQHCL